MYPFWGFRYKKNKITQKQTNFITEYYKNKIINIKKCAHYPYILVEKKQCLNPNGSHTKKFLHNRTNEFSIKNVRTCVVP